MNLKCFFGKHDDEHICRVQGQLTDIFQCKRCGTYRVFFKDTLVSYRTKEFPTSGAVGIPVSGIGDLSDGYHTFNELYHHRAVLFSVICNQNKGLAWKSRKHHDGTMYDGMFIVGIKTPEGQATYHYDIKPYWDMFNVTILPLAPKWDGHTPSEAIERIRSL